MPEEDKDILPGRPQGVGPPMGQVQHSGEKRCVRQWWAAGVAKLSAEGVRADIPGAAV